MSVQLGGGDLRVPVDVCEAHGIWLDQLELGPIFDELSQERQSLVEAERRGPWWRRVVDALTGALDAAGESTIRRDNRKGIV